MTDETDTKTPALAASRPAAAEAPATAGGSKAYTVTRLAGPRVAGRRVQEGDRLELTEPEARSELLTGAIVPEGKKLPKGLEDVSAPVAKQG